VDFDQLETAVLDVFNISKKEQLEALLNRFKGDFEREN
jgi:hypothetical protein